MSNFRLAIGNVVEIPVRFTVVDGGRDRSFAFALLARRLPADELQRVSRDESTTVAEFLEANVSGWRDQTLVLDADGRPAAYSVDALQAMLLLPGLAGLVFTGYLEACGAKGKRGN